MTPTRTRARIYDRDGLLLLDSQTLSARGATLRAEPGESAAEDLPWWRRLWAEARRSFAPTKKLRVNDDWITNGKALPEIADALKGKTELAVRVNAAGETIVSVCVPIQRTATIRGALLLSTQGGDIDSVIASERWALLRFFLVLAAVMLVLSLSLANTIAEPVRKLAEAAERVRRGIKSRQQIPDFTDRSDEIGHLSGALRDMTQALYNRIDAIESFAADVAHELEESAHLVAQRRRNLAAGEIRALARSPARHHAARRAAARPADQRHLRRFAPGRGARARRRRTGRHGGAAARGGRDGGRFAAQQRNSRCA